MTQQQNNWQQQVWQQPAASQPVYTAPPTQQVAYCPPTPQPKKSRGWIVGLAAVAAVFVLCLVGIVSCSSAFSSAFSTSTSSSASSVDLLSGDAVGVIDIDGTIQYDGTTCSPEGLKKQLDKAADNVYIKAVVLRVNSGGGTATAGEEMAAYVKQFREESGKPVVVSSASTNASAAYEISSQADYIYTAKTTAIGAIGTALQVTDVSELLDKLGISIDNITSSDSKDSSYGTRALTDEERAYYQAMVDRINETFIATVAEGRGMDVEAVRALATGLTFTGMDAVENGLADAIGTREDAVAKAAELAGSSTTHTVDLKPKSVSSLSTLMDILYAKSGSSSEDVAAAIKELETDGSIAR